MTDSRSVLNEVIENSRNGESALPPLMVEKSTLEQRWDELLKSISDFMDTWFPTDRALGTSTAEALLLFVWYLAIAIVIIAFLFYITRWIRRDRTINVSTPSLQRSQSISTIEKLLKEALDADDWARAMRLRCLLFILHQDLPMSWSPGADPQVGFEQCMPCYRAMYGSDTASADLYQQFEQLLRRRRRG